MLPMVLGLVLAACFLPWQARACMIAATSSPASPHGPPQFQEKVQASCHVHFPKCECFATEQCVLRLLFLMLTPLHINTNQSHESTASKAVTSPPQALQSQARVAPTLFFCCCTPHPTQAPKWTRCAKAKKTKWKCLSAARA